MTVNLDLTGDCWSSLPITDLPVVCCKSLAPTVQIQERQKNMEKIRETEFDSVRDRLQQHLRDKHFTRQVSDNTAYNLRSNKSLF